MPKTALCISGGGSKGAFAVGAIEYLMKIKRIKFDIVAGTSTGSQMAPLVVTNEIARLKHLYTHIRTEDVIVAHPLAEAFVGKDALNDATPYKTLSGRELTLARAQKIFASPIQMFISTVNFNNGKLIYFQTGPPGVIRDKQARLIHLSDRDELHRAIRASGHEPVFMSPVVVQPDSDPHAYDSGTATKPTDRYFDGGVRVIAPIQIAIDNGATDIYAIVLSEKDKRRNENRYSSVLTTLLRLVSILGQQNSNNDVRIAEVFNDGACYLKALRQKMADAGLPLPQIDKIFADVDALNPFRGTRAVNLYIIRPKEKLPGTSLEFDPGEMARRVLLGRARAKEVFAAKQTCDDRIKLLVPAIA